MSLFSSSGKSRRNIRQRTIHSDIEGENESQDEPIPDEATVNLTQSHVKVSNYVIFRPCRFALQLAMRPGKFILYVW